MRKKTLINKLKNHLAWNRLYEVVIEDLIYYVDTIDSDTVDNTVFHDFLAYHNENGTYQLQNHEEAISFVRDLLPSILDTFCLASRNTFTNFMTLPIDSRTQWWSYEELAIGAVTIAVSEIHKEIFGNDNPISLPYGWRL